MLLSTSATCSSTDGGGDASTDDAAVDAISTEEFVVDGDADTSDEAVRAVTPRRDAPLPSVASTAGGPSEG
jgi:hypothetical protein